jgi:hypothetical protein
VDRVARATMLRKVETKQMELGAVTLTVDNGSAPAFPSSEQPSPPLPRLLDAS